MIQKRYGYTPRPPQPQGLSMGKIAPRPGPQLPQGADVQHQPTGMPRPGMVNQTSLGYQSPPNWNQPAFGDQQGIQNAQWFGQQQQQPTYPGMMPGQQSPWNPHSFKKGGGGGGLLAALGLNQNTQFR